MEINNYAVGKIIGTEKREWEGQNGKMVTYTITFQPDGYKEKDAFFVQTTNSEHKILIDSVKESDTTHIEFSITGRSFQTKAGYQMKLNELKMTNIVLARLDSAIQSNDAGLEESAFPTEDGIPF